MNTGYCFYGSHHLAICLSRNLCAVGVAVPSANCNRVCDRAAAAVPSPVPLTVKAKTIIELVQPLMAGIARISWGSWLYNDCCLCRGVIVDTVHPFPTGYCPDFVFVQIDRPRVLQYISSSTSGNDNDFSRRIAPIVVAPLNNVAAAALTVFAYKYSCHQCRYLVQVAWVASTVRKGKKLEWCY